MGKMKRQSMTENNRKGMESEWLEIMEGGEDSKERRG